jgi:[ribosomal protein S5]-alanine N-acetyltransferase
MDRFTTRAVVGGETGQLANWAVTVDSIVVGRVGLKSIDLEQGIAEITYWILAEHRRRGYAKSAVEVATCWAFNDLGLHRIELTHSTQNLPSCRVAEASGYLLEGPKRLAGLHADGLHDMHLPRESQRTSSRRTSATVSW